MSMRQDDPVAVVTGAARGIGRAVVGVLASRGFRVAGADLVPGASDPACGADPALWVELDVTSAASVAAAAEEVAARLGGVDVLVNNAGVFRQTPLLDLDEQSMQAVLDVNLCGALRCTCRFGRLMAERGGGRIVNVGSISAQTGAALGAVYAASKAGLVALTRSAARELGPHDITVCAVLPGYCDTPMLEERRQIVEQLVVPRIPAGRVATPAEVAEVVGFLATSTTNYLTGSVVALDGGLSAG